MCMEPLASPCEKGITCLLGPRPWSNFTEASLWHKRVKVTKSVCDGHNLKVPRPWSNLTAFILSLPLAQTRGASRSVWEGHNVSYSWRKLLDVLRENGNVVFFRLTLLVNPTINLAKSTMNVGGGKTKLLSSKNT